MEICTIISTYSYIPMLDVNIITEDLIAVIRYVIGKGYTLASERGVIEADSYGQLIHLFKREYCPEEIIEPLMEWAVR